MNDLGQQLRDACHKSGLSVRQLSLQSGVPYSAMHGFFAGTRQLTLKNAGRLTRLLGLELSPIKVRATSKRKAR
jgi:hypothetical protein